MIKMDKLIRLLSEAEKDSVKALAEALGEKDSCIIVASKIAEAYKLTRSVFTVTQTKLEIAEIIETRSLGMKGTKVTILEPDVFKQLVEVIR